MHEWGSWIKNNDIEHIRECKKNTKHKQIEKHSWNNGIITKEVTIKETGIKAFTYDKCHNEKIIIILKLTDIIKDPEVKSQEKLKKGVTEIKPIVKVINPIDKFIIIEEGKRYNKKLNKNNLIRTVVNYYILINFFYIFYKALRV